MPARLRPQRVRYRQPPQKRRGSGCKMETPIAKESLTLWPSANAYRSASVAVNDGSPAWTLFNSAAGDVTFKRRGYAGSPAAPSSDMTAAAIGSEIQCPTTIRANIGSRDLILTPKEYQCCGSCVTALIGLAKLTPDHLDALNPVNIKFWPV